MYPPMKTVLERAAILASRSPSDQRIYSELKSIGETGEGNGCGDAVTVVAGPRPRTPEVIDVDGEEEGGGKRRRKGDARAGRCERPSRGRR